MTENFEMFRAERRSFFCPNKLWKELEKKTNDCFPISQFIRMAILEKLIKDNPEMEEYFKDLLIYKEEKN